MADIAYLALTIASLADLAHLLELVLRLPPELQVQATTAFLAILAIIVPANSPFPTKKTSIPLAKRWKKDRKDRKHPSDHYFLP